jgi:hypothetical protein
MLVDKELNLFNILDKNLILIVWEWYMKNRWWIWTITGVYLAYRLATSLYLSFNLITAR